MLQIRKILYPTDFSECSKQALNQAIFLAEALGAELHMLHAVVLHADDIEDEEHQFPESHELLARMFEVAESRMAELAGQHDSALLRIRQERRRGYSAASVIADYAVENDIDLVVMATHGRRLATRLLLGSTAEEVLRRAPCPVLTLSPRAEPHTAIRRILAPVDFSEHTPRGIELAAELAGRFGAELTLLHVIEWPIQPDFYGWSASQGALDDLTRRADTELRRLAAELTASPTAVRHRALVGHAPAHIVRLVEEDGFDLVVLPTHGLRGFNRLLMGSTAREITRQAACPVLCIGPDSKSVLGEEVRDPQTATG